MMDNSTDETKFRHMVQQLPTEKEREFARSLYDVLMLLSRKQRALVLDMLEEKFPIKH